MRHGEGEVVAVDEHIAVRVWANESVLGRLSAERGWRPHVPLKLWPPLVVVGRPAEADVRGRAAREQERRDGHRRVGDVGDRQQDGLRLPVGDAERAEVLRALRRVCAVPVDAGARLRKGAVDRLVGCLQRLQQL